MTNDPFSLPLIKRGRPEQVRLNAVLPFLKGVIEEKRQERGKQHLVVFLNVL